MSRTPVEQIKEKLSILDVIGAYVELSRAGKSYKGKSPFTNEKTPSFYVSPDRGMYYCFSSSQGGDMFTFIEKMEGVDFKGALKILAEKAGVELVPEDPKKRDARETQYTLLEHAAQYFFRNLSEHSSIQNYIAERGVSKESVHAWRIGYAPDEWRALRKHLVEKGFTDSDMLAAGLIKRADGGKEPYDVFRGRVMFPIFDSLGRVVAFSGRTLKSETGVPKYVNSPETELFQKSEILYGYDKAKNGIRQYDFSLIVEGQFDLVLAHQAGYTNTVAVSGTALTKHHIMLLLRLSKNAVLSLDADRAGVSAVKRSAVPMLEAGMDVKVARLPEGMDPADVVRKNPSDLKKIVGGAVHVVEFLLGILKMQSKDERTYKLRVREEVLPLLVAMDNRIDREHFEGIIAEHIGATKDGVHYEVERLEELHTRSREAARVPTQAGETDTSISRGGDSTARRQNLENQVRALIAVSTGERAWVKDRMEEVLTNIMGDDAFQVLTSTDALKNAGREIFMLESHTEGMREKQFLEEVSHTLTHYVHLIARERLGLLKQRLKEAEETGNDVLPILEESKEVEKLLSRTIELSR